MNNNLNQKEFDLKDAFISKEPRIEREEKEKKGWYIDQKSNGIEDNFNNLADNKDYIKNECALEYEMSLVLSNKLKFISFIIHITLSLSKAGLFSFTFKP